MELFDAMRIGAHQRPQGFEELASVDETEDGSLTIGATCALGAVCDGAGIVFLGDGEEWAASVAMRARFPVLEDFFPIPVDAADLLAGEEVELEAIIWRLNDYARWSREQIADWLEGVLKTRA